MSKSAAWAAFVACVVLCFYRTFQGDVQGKNLFMLGALYFQARAMS